MGLGLLPSVHGGAPRREVALFLVAVHERWFTPSLTLPARGREPARNKGGAARGIGQIFLMISLLRPRIQHRQERLLRDVDVADRLHPLLAFLCFAHSLRLRRDVAAVALGGDVLAHRRDRFAGDDRGCRWPPAWRPRTCAGRSPPAASCTIAAAAAVGVAPVADDRQGVDPVAVRPGCPAARGRPADSRSPRSPSCRSRGWRS